MGGICGIVLSMKHQQMMFFCYNGIGIEWDVYESFKWDTMEIFRGKLMLQPEGPPRGFRCWQTVFMVFGIGMI
jgi:hypothetical protein